MGIGGNFWLRSQPSAWLIQIPVWHVCGTAEILPEVQIGKCGKKLRLTNTYTESG